MENFKIIEDKQNPLFKRREVISVVEAKINPSYSEGMKLISKNFSTDVKNVKIKSIKGKFGSYEFTIVSNIYDSEEAKKKYEKLSKKDEIVEEKPVEEVKEEIKSEVSEEVKE